MNIRDLSVAKIKKFAVGYLTKGHPRSVEAKKNIVASVFIKGFSIVINLILVPLTIQYVDVTKYGIWVALSSIIAWFSFFDIGFGHGLRNRFAEAKASGDIERARVYVSTTYAILTFIFVPAWGLFFILNRFVDWAKILNSPAGMSRELEILAFVVFSCFCLQMIFKTIVTIIVADQKPARAGFIDMLGRLLTLIAVLVLIKIHKGSLIYLGLAFGGAPLITDLLASIWYYQGQYKYFSPSLRHVDFTKIKDIMDLGVKFFIIQLSAIIAFQSTYVIISNILGPEQVTIYNIAYKYFFVMATLANIIAMPMWSAFTEAYTNEDYVWMKNIVRKLNKVWCALACGVALMLLGANMVYRLWIGQGIVIPFSVSFFMAINLLATTRFNIFVTFINGIGKLNVQLYSYIIVGIFFIPIAILMGKYFGLNGVIGANICISSFFAIIAPRQVNLLLSKKATGMWNR